MVEIVKTREQLIERAATELGALTSGQPLSEEDNDTIDTLVDPLLRSLSMDDIVDIDNSEEIPAEYFLPVSMLLANVAAPSFGQQFSEEVKTTQEKILRRLTSGRPTYENLRTEFF